LALNLWEMRSSKSSKLVDGADIKRASGKKEGVQRSPELPSAWTSQGKRSELRLRNRSLHLAFNKGKLQPCQARRHRRTAARCGPPVAFLRRDVQRQTRICNIRQYRPSNYSFAPSGTLFPPGSQKFSLRNSTEALKVPSLPALTCIGEGEISEKDGGDQRAMERTSGLLTSPRTE
jgi:hypothetical protein